MAGKLISVLLNPFPFTSDTNFTEMNAFQASDLLDSGWGRGLRKVPRLCTDSDILCQDLMPPHAAVAVTTRANISLYHS